MSPTRRHRNRRSNRHIAKQRTHNSNSDKGVIVGLIFANWCGHCQSLKPHWQNMKKSLATNPKFRNQGCKVIEIEDSDSNKDKKIAQINATIKGPKLVANGYPTIFKKTGGTIEYYGGERQAPALLKWAIGGAHDNQMMGGYILRSSPGSRKTKKSKPRY